MDTGRELLEIRRLLLTPRWSYSLQVDSWFFPNDLLPHSTRLKYVCKELHKHSLLDRDAACGRWGYRYKIK